MNKIKGLEGIYNLRKAALGKIVSLLYKSNTKGINKKYITKTYNTSWNLYNSLTNVINYLESIY